MHSSFKSKNESGHGVAEMIGFMVIVAVLTIGSVGLYQVARNAAHTQSIITEVRLRLLALSRHGAAKNKATSLQTLRGLQKKPNQSLIMDKYELELEQNGVNNPVLIIHDLPLEICSRLKAKVDISCDSQHNARFDLSFLNSNPK